MNLNKKPLIVIMTDFGNDHYTGVMKGVILQINPFANIISLTNNIQNHNIKQGAFILLKSYKYFPQKTIFLVVVDPGVGGSRKAIGAQAENYFFIGPDNGILSPTLSTYKKYIVVDLPTPSDSSPSFHGRDVFAPVAGKLSRNYSLLKLGAPTTIQTSFNIHWDSISKTGEVIFIDHFGNIITNIPKSIDLVYNEEYMVSTSRTKMRLRFRRSYFDGSNTNPFLIINSFETLEIALQNSRASDVLDITPGDQIQIHFSKK